MAFSIAFSVVLASGSVIDLDGTYFVQLIVFFIAFFLLRSLVFKPIMNLFEAREHAIEGTRLEARKMDIEAEEKRDSIVTRLQEARETANEQREKLRIEGQSQARELMSKAREQSEHLLAETRQRLDTEAESVRKEVSVLVPALARQIASKLLDREVN